jgi:hypothetical protein
MGIFGKKEQINLSAPGEVAVAEHVATAIPDAGEYFMDWIGGYCNEQMYARLKADVDSRRAPNGWLVASKFTDVPQLGRKQTPMTFLSTFVGGRDVIIIAVWGTSGNRGKDYKALEGTLAHLVHTQGHGAAATWAIIARPEARLSLEYLSQALHDGWSQSHEFLRNGDLIKAFRNWNK